MTDPSALCYTDRGGPGSIKSGGKRIREMRSIGRTFMTTAVLVGLCAPGARAATGNDAVVATVGSYNITEQQIDTKLRAQLASLQVQLYDLKRTAVEQMADDFLVQQAAKKAHLSPAAYLKQQIDDKVAEPSDADLHKIYDQIKAQTNQSYDQVKLILATAIKDHERQQLHDQLMQSLRTMQGYKLLLQPPRFAVNANDRPSLGPSDAPVTIVEFGDYQDAYSGRSENTIRQIRANYGDKLRLVFMDFPVEKHPAGMDAARAARCAGEQGKFWEFHNAVFADQTKLAVTDLKATAANLKLDTAKFDDCLDKHKYDSDIAKDIAEGKSLGVDGTPVFFINGRMLLGAQPQQKFNAIISEELPASTAANATKQAKK